jgi:hypothetical protein
MSGGTGGVSQQTLKAYLSRRASVVASTISSPPTPACRSTSLVSRVAATMRTAALGHQLTHFTAPCAPSGVLNQA